jgi:mono/diheme cytochrome c family protein
MAMLALLLGSPWLAGCRHDSHEQQARVARDIGNPDRGRRVIRDRHCGSCHTIPGVRGAEGVVGPPLDFFSRRTYIAGELPNTPGNLVRWVMDPQSIEPATAMPALGLDQRDAHDVAAYLYTLQ